MTVPAASLAERWGRPAALALLLTAVALALVWTDLPHRSPDSGWYLQMARGEAEGVPAPFAGRLVHTGLARLAMGAGLDAEWAFVAVAVPAFWILLTTVFGLHRWAGVPVAVTLAAVTGWFAPALLRDATLPDVHAAAWLGVVAVAAVTRSPWTLPLLVGAVLCRESLALFALVLAVMAWRDGQAKFALAVVAAAGVGLVLAAVLSGAANVHGVGGLLYLATKAVFNLSRNLFGLELYVETIDYCEPTRTWTLPGWVPSGNVREVGICGFNPRRPLWLLISWSAVFGVLPGWFWARRGQVRRVWGEAPLWMRAALVYGLLVAVLAPAAGTMLDRLVGYGWPAFWLAAPILGEPVTGTRRQLFALGTLHVAASVGVMLMAWSAPVSAPVLLAAAVLGVGLNAGAAVLTARTGGEAIARPS